MDSIQIISCVLLLVLFFLGFRVMEMNWSYKISKPWQWEDAVKNGQISKHLQSLERSYRDKVRLYNIWLQVERLKQLEVPGAFAELGVYKGETAALLHEMDADRKLLLFDTFEGFNARDLAKEQQADPKYSEKNFSDTSLEAVKQRLGEHSQLEYYPGYFPESAAGIAKQAYAFVHLDADLYVPTREGLAYFYPLLSPGGVLLIHDYHHTWPGVKQAVDEFAASIPESLVPISDWQGSVMIIKNR